MSEHPILFSAPMVRAILSGAKTQTRRVLKPQPQGHTAWQDDDTGEWWVSGHGEVGDTLLSLRWAPGDRLWVRETWNVFALSSDGDESWPLASIPPVDPRTDPEMRRAYCVDYPVAGLPGTDGGNGPWRPSIHMPRWASRITLEVEAVRVERLHDITEADAVAEGMVWRATTPEDIAKDEEHCREVGVQPHKYLSDGAWLAPGADRPNDGPWGMTARDAFHALWNAIHGPDAWDANPWVSVTTFRRKP